MSEAAVAGIRPWLPWPLANSAWWTEPVRAERLAALRIGVGATLLLDVLGTYLPQASDFFGPGSLGSAEVFAARVSAPHWRWSVLGELAGAQLVPAMLWLWALAAVLLILGVMPRLAAVFAWGMSISVFNANYYLHNSGDNVRAILLFYLMLCPCGAAWSLVSWWRRRRGDRRAVYISPWPLRLLMVQLALAYCFNGLYKLSGDDWSSGLTMHYVMGDVGWTRLPFAAVPLPDLLLVLSTYLVLYWELSFPLLMVSRVTRKPALWLGVMFHLGTAVCLQLTMFPFYMLCLYLPLVPWEEYADRR